MDLNIHPIFVHFPIALLTTYSIFELIRFRKILSLPYWFYTKALLVIFGAASGYVALQTGNMARSLLADQHNDLVATHETWAQFSVLIYSILAAGYVAAWLKQHHWDFIERSNFLSAIWKLCLGIQKVITETPLVWVLAAGGLISLSIAGALGGSIVYGSSGDPFTSFVYHLFFSN